jgi:signal transduction histidine kinase
MRTGLRTEIILSISLLLAAALLFAGFLMVKLTEHNLLEQQRVHAASIIRLVAAGIDDPASLAGSQSERALSSLNRLQTLLSQQPGLLAWRLLDARLQILSSTAYETTQEFTAISPSVLEVGELHESLSYQAFRFFNAGAQQSYLDLSTPLWQDNQPYGLLQIRFSLEGLRARVLGAQKLILGYVVVYGLILAVFGVYLLNRNVVKPVRQLHQATTTVAGGVLAPVKVLSGPGEIHALADSFNTMVTALSASRAETEEHIASLEETNQALAQARDDLVRSEKLATVGHLAAGMAHEIGNPLGAVVGYLNILQSDLSGESRDLVVRSLAETARIDKLIRELLEFSAPLDHQLESFDPIESLRETLELLRHQGQLESIRVDDRCSDAVCPVNMDRGRLVQVWINLLLNARDAMQGEGQIVLSSETDGRVVTLAIQDDGPGVAPDVAARIFEPFYTTKDPGSGYGLGLAVCQRIIDENGGSLKLSQGAAKGACFSVTLPCLEVQP